MIEQAKQVAERLREMDAAKKHHPSGPCGQMVGCESYRLVATGFTFQQLHDGADTIDALVQEAEQYLSDWKACTAMNRELLAEVERLQEMVNLAFVAHPNLAMHIDAARAALENKHD